ncbi:hypothetical protein GWI33_002995, partial [Rhynchophorus ferrugineus]
AAGGLGGTDTHGQTDETDEREVMSAAEAPSWAHERSCLSSKLPAEEP